MKKQIYAIAFAFLSILIAVLIFTIASKNNQANLILLNERNNLILGDLRTTQQNLNNAISLDFSKIVILDSNKKNIIQLDSSKQSSEFFKIIKEISVDNKHNEASFKFIFYLPFSSVLFLSFLIWVLFLFLAIPFFIAEKRKLQSNFELEIMANKEKAFQDLAIQISHDIRSPIAVINSIKKEFERNDFSNLNELYKAINRINKIANNFLTEEKEHSSEFTVILHELNAHDLIMEQINQKKIEIGSDHNIEIEYNSNNFESISVHFNSDELSRIFSNLLNNSIEALASKTNGKILVSLQFSNGYLGVAINDNGSGINKEVLEKLGTMRVSSKNTNENSGSGIGFLSAKNMLEKYNGSLSISSELNKGTEAIIKLPASNNPPIKVVLIDDDELIRLLWIRSAKIKKIDFTTFENSLNFKKQIEQFPKNTVFYIDSNLKEIKGEDLALELHESGFTNINITSGHPAENFKKFQFLKSIIGKNPPF